MDSQNVTLYTLGDGGLKDRTAPCHSTDATPSSGQRTTMSSQLFFVSTWMLKSTPEVAEPSENGLLSTTRSVSHAEGCEVFQKMLMQHLFPQVPGRSLFMPCSDYIQIVMSHADVHLYSPFLHQQRMSAHSHLMPSRRKKKSLGKRR